MKKLYIVATFDGIVFKQISCNDELIFAQDTARDFASENPGEEFIVLETVGQYVCGTMWQKAEQGEN